MERHLEKRPAHPREDADEIIEIFDGEAATAPPLPEADEVEVFDAPGEVPPPAPASVPLPAPASVPLPAPAFAADVSTDGDDVLSLFAPAPEPAAPEPAAGQVDEVVAGARDLFALGDFTGALELLEGALARDPHHAEALGLFERTEETLVQMYESKLGRLSQTPRVRLQPDEIVWLNLDHRAGFVLAQIDGRVSLEDIFALSGMSRLDTAKILVELLEQGAIAS